MGHGLSIEEQSRSFYDELGIQQTINTNKESLIEKFRKKREKIKTEREIRRILKNEVSTYI